MTTWRIENDFLARLVELLIDGLAGTLSRRPAPFEP